MLVVACGLAGCTTVSAPVTAHAAPVALADVPAVALASPAAVLGDSGYTRVKFGAFDPSGDIAGLDTGIYGELAFGKDLAPFFGIDLSFGYLEADRTSDRKLRAAPLFLNGRLQLPLLVFNVYGGAGIGGLYADYTLGPVDDDDFLLAANVFAGIEVGLDNLAIGLEYRYLATEETSRDFRIEGHTLFAVATLPF